MPQFVMYLFFAVLQAAGGHGDAFTKPEDCDAGRKEFIEKHKEDLLSLSDCVAVNMLPAGKPDAGIVPKPNEEKKP